MGRCQIPTYGDHGLCHCLERQHWLWQSWSHWSWRSLCPLADARAALHHSRLCCWWDHRGFIQCNYHEAPVGLAGWAVYMERPLHALIPFPPRFMGREQNVKQIGKFSASGISYDSSSQSWRDVQRSNKTYWRSCFERRAGIGSRRFFTMWCLPFLFRNRADKFCFLPAFEASF